ncbi:hypothetical protein CHLNCDRAFT_133863 [Chlorella variabilis]|uniref:Uncharacterized protein n=1 Tax=Chlorella variabilis TaxID=554065 RepID=E1ZFF0_CHLVA|nr:hypothetical protein CHLNCDRAFT_133863 [Chlorella variabilis]EFN55658.1 hypothetical protein CHLNCDRAFT_133863 [Chlorella variabilis]|eukprot:XP_005847760.1 hypothetical protein CHLNCDRAFT_133863 [Chlorella variabilis]
MAMQQQASQPSPQPSAGQQMSQPSQQRGSAARAAKPRPKRPYKPPHQVAQERKLKDEANDYIRRLEQQLGKARSELERLQRDNTTLQRKAVVLSKHSSFRRCAAGMVQELQESMTLGEQLQSMDCSQHVLDAAEKGLPEPQVLEYLRKMTSSDAVQHYNSVVARVRALLQQLDQGPDPEVAQQQLEDIFALRERASTFGYLQVVNPPVYAELMQAKLDPDSPVDRCDPAHWRAVLAAMGLSEEQESQLILLLQSYLQQREQVVQRKSKVMQQLADELSSDLLSLELSQDGSTEVLAEEDSAGDEEEGGGGGGVQRQPSANAKAQQAKDELDRLVQLEYWLKFDFTGCVRKLLPAQQQALCMVHSWPFYPDQKQIEGAIKEKAGPLWEQLARSAA